MTKDLPNINGYQLVEGWTTSGSCRWSYAEKNGCQWFIKQFMAPKYKRIEDGISPKKVESSKKRCEEFRERQNALYKQVRAANTDTGNIVTVDDFFSFESMFYSVSKRIDISSLSVSDVASMEHSKKMILLKVLTHSINSLHKYGVIHADIKPDNILIKKTKVGYTFKVIDFDASFLDTDPKRGEKICFDASFVAPETILACNDETIALTSKIDIFALGLMFHLYYSGTMPMFSEEFPNVCSAVSAGQSVLLDSSLPDWMQRMIYAMLLPNPEHRPDTATIFQALRKEEYSPEEGSSLITDPLPEPDPPAKPENKNKGFHLPPKLPTK